MEGQPTDWEKMFANNMPDEGLVCHLCKKKSLKTIIQKSIRKGTKYMNTYFSEDGIAAVAV